MEGAMAEQATGRITFSNGAPATGVRVRVFDRDIGGADDDLTITVGQSSADGRFVVTYDRARAADKLTIALGFGPLKINRTINDPLDFYSPYLELRYQLRGQERVQHVSLEASPQEVHLSDAPPITGTFAPSTHGFRFANSFEGTPLPFTIPALPGLSQIPASYGLCGGMSAAAADYFYARRPIPETGDIPKKGTKLYNYLFRRQIDSFSPLGEPILRFMKWMKMEEQTPLGTWHRSMEEFAYLRAQFDSGLPVHPIGLVFANPGEPLWENHQVLACGYTQVSPSRYEIKLYDPNFPWNDQVFIRADVMSFRGTDSAGQQTSVTTLRCRRVAVVADAQGRPTEQNRPMRGIFLMPYSPVAPPAGL
jgi:hypothetical protein